MFTKFTHIAIASTAVLLAFPQLSTAQAKEPNIFKASEFLAWSEQNRNFYIRTNVGMASLIVGQTSKRQAQCIDGWYINEENNGHAFILEKMHQFSEFHPRGVLLAVLEKKCGAFSYTIKQ